MSQPMPRTISWKPGPSWLWTRQHLALWGYYGGEAPFMVWQPRTGAAVVWVDNGAWEPARVRPVPGARGPAPWRLGLVLGELGRKGVSVSDFLAWHARAQQPGWQPASDFDRLMVDIMNRTAKAASEGDATDDAR